MWRNHRLHHYKNEHYWFTVTSAGTADRLFGTYPDPETVPTSADREEPARRRLTRGLPNWRNCAEIAAATGPELLNRRNCAVPAAP